MISSSVNRSGDCSGGKPFFYGKTFHGVLIAEINAGDVSGETLAHVGPWLAALIQSKSPLPIPVSSLSEYTAHATYSDGSLVLTVSGPKIKTGPLAGTRPPLVSIGVQRAASQADAWEAMTGPKMPPAAPGIKRPAAPYCAVILWPSIATAPDALEWLGDFEQCIAWARINDNPE